MYGHSQAHNTSPSVGGATAGAHPPADLRMGVEREAEAVMKAAVPSRPVGHADPRGPVRHAPV